MGAIVLVPAFNTPGKSDATGAFHPEARAFVALHGYAGAIAHVDNRLPLRERRKRSLEHIATHKPRSIGVFAAFCHGWRDGLQVGFLLPHARQMAEALAAVAEPDLRVVLYACDAARDADEDRADDTATGPGGDGGFADALRGHLSVLGLRATVYAHATPGHTTRNPFVRVFPPGELGGGHWMVEPRSALWKPWVKALRDTSLRLRFPFMTGTQVEDELGDDSVA